MEIRDGFERWREDLERAGNEDESPAMERTRRRRFLLDSYLPFEKQDTFHRCKAKYRLFGGAAGPGKSKALLMEAVLQANENAGANTLLLRRTFPELESSLLTYFRRDIPRELYLAFNDSKHLVTWRNGSTTRFGYCRAEGDVYQYQGAEFLFIGIDELTLFTLKQWQFLTSRNRSPGKNAFACMAGATNPGNIGHAWVKALWIDGRPAPGMEHAEEYDRADYVAILARVEDNPIYARDEEYLRTLRALPEHLRRAFLDGDWNLFAGQYFDNFDFGRHVIRAEEAGLGRYWPRHISVDWGFEHPAAVYWHASDGQRQITYRELVQNHLTPRALGEEIVSRSRGTSGETETIRSVYLSPDAFAQRTGSASIAEQIGDALSAAGLPRPERADDDRVAGWMLMYQMLAANEWVITDNCAELIRTLPNLTRDATRIEDVQKRDGDDAADAARYGLKSRRAPVRIPLEARLADRTLSEDPTTRAMQVRRAMAEDSKKRGPVYFAPGRHRRH